MPRMISFCGIAAVLLGTSLFAADEPSAADLEFFEKRIRPLLADNCFECHSADKQKANLRLDSREAAIKGGDSGPAIDPGHPDESLLIEAVNYGGDTQMPPKGKLADEKIADLKEWIQRGAPWPKDKPKDSSVKKEEFNLQARKAKQWAFQPVASVKPPAVADAAWARTDADRFLLARLEAAGLRPAPPADKRTLLRRATFDLIGLPPTPDETAAFLADDSPRAFETVVDRLLASPHYGERWARHWLDLVRFAETHGHEFDFEIPYAFEYRDYVIRALNADVPYDQFAIEHIAGDLLERPRRDPATGVNESIIGTGFYFLGEAKHSPVDILGDMADRLDNQIDVFGKTFLACTLGCARCHDHKFDAISQKDYYALAGYLQSSRYKVACIDPPEERLAHVKELAEIHRLKEAAIGEGRQAAVAKEAIPAYLLGALAAMKQDQDAPPETGALEGDVVFADFEDKTYVGWVSSGTAFGTQPNRGPLPEYQGDIGALGRGFVNSHSYLDAKGQRVASDEHTGRLTSRAFRIERPYIHFLIGGGSHEGKTCLNLKVGDAVVRTATGESDNRLGWKTFEVREFAGKQAVLEIVDAETGGWGNIGVDQIVFSRSPLAGPAGRRLAAVASQRKLDADRLAAWVQTVKDSAADPSHPLFHWGKLVEVSGTPVVQASSLAQARQEFTSRHNPPAAALKDGSARDAADDAIVFEDFSQETFKNWFVTGEAFGSGPLRAPGVVLGKPGLNLGRVLSPGVAHSGFLGPKLQGALRSRTFVIDRPRILYHLAGTNVKLRLVIDSYQLIRNPIYGGLEITLKEPGPLKWHVQNVDKWIGHRAYIEILDDGDGQAAIDRIVFTSGGSPAETPHAAASAAFAEPSKTLKELAERFAAAIATTTWSDDLPLVLAVPATAALDERAARIAERIKYSRFAIAMTDGTGLDESVFLRGNPKKPGDSVPRRLLEAAAGADQPAPAQGSGRLELAKRIVDPANPLTARVIVNRVWKHHFGEGLAATPDDFGNMGQPPSHPELLDFLTSEFIQNGWSLKTLHKRLLLTSAYQMSSQPADSQAEERDPQNRLWHRMPVRRLEAEIIRDAMLAVSGRLDRTVSGPSVMPHLTPFMLGRGRPSQSGPLDGNGRRSVYLNVRRNFLTPMFLAFDYPIPFNTIGRRSVSNVPAQALALMNNPFVTSQAEVWAGRIVAAESDPDGRIRRMYEAAFTRQPTPEELAAAREFIILQADQYRNPADPRPWTDFAHVLFNVKEFIFVN